MSVKSSRQKLPLTETPKVTLVTGPVIPNWLPMSPYVRLMVSDGRTYFHPPYASDTFTMPEPSLQAAQPQCVGAQVAQVLMRTAN